MRVYCSAQMKAQRMDGQRYLAHLFQLASMMDASRAEYWDLEKKTGSLRVYCSAWMKA